MRVYVTTLRGCQRGPAARAIRSLVDGGCLVGDPLGCYKSRDSMSAEQHKAHAPPRVRVFLLTVSDSRTPATDTSGQLARALLEAAGHEVAGYEIVRDEPSEVARVVASVAGGGAADVLVTSGGTGISRRDNTYEAIAGLLDKRLDGFGELFRMLSYQEIGSAAMLSRAVGGLVGGLVVFALPGSSGAVRLGLEKLILPELGHLAFERGR